MKVANQNNAVQGSNVDPRWEIAPKFYLNGSTNEERFGILTLSPTCEAKWDNICNKIETVQNHLSVKPSKNGKTVVLMSGNSLIGVINNGDVEILNQMLKDKYLRFNQISSGLELFD